MKQSSRNQLIITIVNALVIMGAIGFLVYRLMDFKAQFAQIDRKNIQNDPLSDVLIAQIDLLQQDRLYDNEDGTYSFRGYVLNNYVSYNGLMYRIVEINENGEIVLISNESVTLQPLAQRARLDKTPVYLWLNSSDDEFSGIFEKTLNDKAEYLTACTNDFSAIDSANDRSRRTTGTGGYVTLLSLFQYQNSGGAESFLHGSEPFWLSNVDGRGFSYYVAENGSVELGTDTDLLLGVRPVITLKAGLKVSKGSGTADDPYIVNENDPYQAKDIWVGTFVIYSNMLWRVTGKDANGNLIITSVDLAQDGGEPVSTRYSSRNYYNLQIGAGHYFNNTYLKKMYRYKDFLTANNWPIGGAMDTDNFDYRDSLQRSLECYVALPTLSDMFLGDCHDEYRLMLLNPFTLSQAYSVSDYRLQSFNVTKDGNYRICVCLKGSLMVADGFGTREDPYVLEVDEG
ncbi:MAG: hypothetical protein J5694_00225 [Erysipelotrichaceae bacterium]|nr:hypothetical protein [Erysipelotrichaceae bacterium]